VTITSKSSATIIPINAAKKPLPVPRTFERFKEAWQLQVAADNSLPAGSLRVALAISSHMNRSKNGLAWPGYNRLQGMLGIDRSTVIRNVKRLEKAGHLTVERRLIGSRNAPNQYRPKLKDASKSHAQDATTLVAQLCHHPSGTDATTLVAPVPPEPLNEPLSEPLNEPLQDTGAVSTAPKDIQIKGVADEVRQITVASSDNPLSSSQRSRRGSEATGLFSEHWFLAGDPRNRNGGRRR
jgi:DNA-binding MarR family transcriptional regulator